MSHVPAAPPGVPPRFGDREPAEAFQFHEVLRMGRRGWWWPLLGIVSLVLLVLIGQAIVTIPFAALLALRGKDSDAITRQLGGDGPASPSFLAVVNLGWAVAILAVWFVVWAFHDVKPRWVESVRPRLRWRWLAVCFGLALVALLATLVVGAFLPSSDDGSGSIGNHLNAITAQTWQYLLVVLLLTPLQAAGEEHAFRGYLMQFCGAIVPDRRVARVVAVVVSAFVFALAHGVGQGLEIFVDRFAFGLGAAVLVVITGGLEAGIAMHVLNNFLAFGVAVLFGDMTEALHATGGSWWGLIGTVVQIGVWLGLTVPVARRMGIQDRTVPTGAAGPTVLSPSRGPV